MRVDLANESDSFDDTPHHQSDFSFWSFFNDNDLNNDLTLWHASLKNRFDKTEPRFTLTIIFSENRNYICYESWFKYSYEAQIQT